MSIFDSMDFESVQNFVFPLIKALGGPDIKDHAIDNADVLLEAAEFLDLASQLLGFAGEAMQDGLLSKDELNGIVTLAPTLGQALSDIGAAIGDKRTAEYE